MSDTVSIRSYRLVVLSNVFFFLASLFYLLSALQDFRNNKDIEDPQLQLQQQQRYLLLCVGAFGFVLVGILDWFNKKHWFHIFLILAGIFGLISEILALEHESGSEYTNLISVHCFLLEAISLLKEDDSYQTSTLSSLRWMIRIANFCFVIGSIVDVILSYIYLNEKESLSSMERSDMLKQGELSSAILWTIAGIGYMCVTCIRL